MSGRRTVKGMRYNGPLHRLDIFRLVEKTEPLVERMDEIKRKLLDTFGPVFFMRELAKTRRHMGVTLLHGSEVTYWADREPAFAARPGDEVENRIRRSIPTHSKAVSLTTDSSPLLLGGDSGAQHLSLPFTSHNQIVENELTAVRDTFGKLVNPVVPPFAGRISTYGDNHPEHLTVATFLEGGLHQQDVEDLDIAIGRLTVGPADFWYHPVMPQASRRAS